MYQTFTDPSATDRTPQRVAELRAAVAAAGLDAFLVPRSDQHRGEYVAASSERLAWLTGFSGSAGMAALTQDRAVLLIDGRYTVQAKNQVPGQLFEIRQVPGSNLEDWLEEAVPESGTVGFDPWLHSLHEIETWGGKLKRKGIRLKPVARNPVDTIWGAARPTPPAAPLVIQPQNLAGTPADDKLAEIQRELAKVGEDAVVLTAPDSVAWLLNIRGSDIPHTPVALCFAIVPKRGKVELFVDRARLDDTVRAHLRPVAKVVSPTRFGERLAELKSDRKSVRIAPMSCNWWIVRKLGGPKRVARGPDPCVMPKAIKTAAEIRGSRRAHVRDGSAMCRFLAWLDRTAPGGTVDEIGAARQLEAFRAETGKLEDISFDTISGSGPHGAIVHYRVTEASNRRLRPGDLYLVDSGAQYRDATTDITRTVAIGNPGAEACDRFTRVLRGHIAIATAAFPEGTRGIELDPLARQPLWAVGLDFDHGTGHGVGSYLSVHEGPQSISKRGMAELRPGMIISNEPGYYKEGAYGIRIENLVLVLPAKKPVGGERAMMTFETLTLAPIDRRLIVAELLSEEERAWLDAYHARVADDIGPTLEGADRDWLAAACAPL